MMPEPVRLNGPAKGSYELFEGDCRTVSIRMKAQSFDAVVTDPPYELGFMDKSWDSTGVAFDVNTWKRVYRLLRPGGYMLAFGGTKTYHRMVCAIEDAGFEIRDCIMWLYGTGFPKGEGSLKPGWEPIVLCRRLGDGMRPLNVDECRVPLANGEVVSCTGRTDPYHTKHEGWVRPWMLDKEKVEATKKRAIDKANNLGRYPANVVHDGSEEVMEAFAAYGDTGTAARFFYCAKASKAEREKGLESLPLREGVGTISGDADGSLLIGSGNSGITTARNFHPTVKPLALIRWLCRLITPPGGTVLDPFAGSGTTLIAALREGLKPTGIELDPEYCPLIRARLKGYGYA